MWKFCRKKGEEGDMNKIPNSVAIAIIISAVALAIAAGVARWSWLLLDEQIKLRNDFEKLKNDQKQTEIQYDVWLKKLQEEGREMRDALDNAETK